MTEAEELELLELEEMEAQLGAAAPAPKGPPQVGAAETFLNKTNDALPLGRQLAQTLAALGMQGAKALGVGSPGARMTPQAMQEAQAAGIDAQAPREAIGGFGDSYRDMRERIATRTEAGAEQHPIAAGLGTGVGTAMSLLAPLPKVKVGLPGATGRVLSNAATGAAYGSLNGAANSRGDLLNGEVGQVLGDAVGLDGMKAAYQQAKEGNYGRAALATMGAGGLGGGLTGGVLGGAVEGLRKPVGALVRTTADKLQSLSNRKALNALGAMKPELNALGSEGAQKVGQFANDAGIVTPLASRATMAERIEALRKAAGEKLSGSLGELDSLALPAERINSADAARRVEQLAAETAQRPALRNIANKFSTEADNIRASAAAGESPGGMSLEQFEREVARPYKQTTNWNADVALPKETLKRLPLALEGEVERIGGDISKRTGSDALSRYKAAKGEYGNLRELADIAEEGIKRQASNHTFSLKDVAMAGPAAMLGSHHGSMGSVLAGAGGVGLSKLANRFGDQMSASGARALAKILRDAPQLAGEGMAATAPTLLSPSERLKLQSWANALQGDVSP